MNKETNGEKRLFLCSKNAEKFSDKNVSMKKSLSVSPLHCTPLPHTKTQILLTVLTTFLDMS